MNRVHFIGMGGIGMSALARVWMQRGAAAQGSDLAASALLEELQREGAQIVIGHRREAIANAEMVVYSTDIKEENEELAAAREQKLPVFHRSEFLDFLMRGKKPLLVTGTHGKTTTTSLLAHVLVEAKWDPSFVIGGIHKNHATNGKNGSGAYFVAEADESDGSFLRTKAFGAIVTNLEDEHLNHWKNSEKLDEAFAQFCDRVERSDLLFWCGDDPRLCDLSPRGVSYGFAAQDLRIVRWSRTETGLSFDLEWKEMKWSGVDLSLYGKHNALNGAAVFGLCLSLGVEEEAIRRAFSTFAGSKRRLEWKGALHGVDLYDDYGHHPTEIAAALSALRDRVRERRLVAVFQPHRYSRVKDLFDQFAGSFAAADLVLMTDIYAAGEAPLEGATTALLYAKMRGLLGPKLYYAVNRVGGRNRLLSRGPVRARTATTQCRGHACWTRCWAVRHLFTGLFVGCKQPGQAFGHADLQWVHQFHSEWPLRPCCKAPRMEIGRSAAWSAVWDCQGRSIAKR